MSFAADLERIFKEGNPHMTLATIGVAPVYGEFNQPFSDESGTSGLGSEFTGTTAKLGAVVYNTAITILGVSYRVKSIRPHGGDSNLITLVLEDQS